MRKTLVTLTAAMMTIFLAACGNSNAGTESTALSDVADTLVSTADTDATASGTESDTGSVSTAVAKPEYVQVAGVVYQNTGYLSSAMGCGNMDGEITSSVDSAELPSKDNQSNFGTGYGYQIGGEDTILVDIQGEKWIFRDINSEDNSIPIQVACFLGTVMEIDENTILIRYDGMPEDALNSAPNEGEYVASSSAAAGDIQVGDEVEVWYSGYVMETDPAQIDAYRIDKLETADM